MTIKGAAQPKKRGNSKPNVKRRGDTYTYYRYVTDHLGRRKQHTKGGYKTQREAEDARVAALAALQTGSYVRAEKQTVGGFQMKEWLPSRKPPVLEESTWVSYTSGCTSWRGSVSFRSSSSPVNLKTLPRAPRIGSQTAGSPETPPTELTPEHMLCAPRSHVRLDRRDAPNGVPGGRERDDPFSPSPRYFDAARPRATQPKLSPASHPARLVGVPLGSWRVGFRRRVPLGC